MDMRVIERCRERWYVLVVIAAAAYFAIGVLWLRSLDPKAVGANDLYTYEYPSLLYAARSLRSGGAGLFWNPYQDCGQPFFAISQIALLYPVNWLTALLEREPALIISVIVNLSIAGAAVYLLAREMQLAPLAAVSAALAFELGGTALDMAAWSPVHMAPYAWLAVALWCTERLVNRPCLVRAASLGGALALQLLPGFPQIAFFTYQLIALRVTWALMLGQTTARMALAEYTLLGLLLPVGLAAVQLLPSIEVARESVRSLPLDASDIGGFRWSWQGVRVLGSVDWLRISLAAVALVAYRGRARASVLFYTLVIALYFALAWGPGTPLFDLYARLPMGQTFRGSARFLWVVGFALAVLAGLGVQSILDRRAQGFRRASVVLAILVGAAGVFQLAAGLSAGEWAIVLLLSVVVIAAAAQQRFATALIPALIGIYGIVAAPKPYQGLRSGDFYDTNAAAFRFVQERLTAQDRVLIVGRPGDYALMPKSAMLFGIPDAFDYEPQAARSYVEYFTFMRTGHGLQDLEEWYWIFRRMLPETLQPPLFDLLAIRYVLVDRAADLVPAVLRPRLQFVQDIGAVRIYANGAALPRAFYVPRVVVKDEADVLPALMNGSVDARRTAVVSGVPRTGFTGAQDNASGSADIVDNSPERVAVRVRASAPGFLYLGDQMFPGWRAQVNGIEHEILRANHTFRLVEVPAGESEVVFTYHPRAVWVGAAISMLTIVGLAVACAMARGRVRAGNQPSVALS